MFDLIALAFDADITRRSPSCSIAKTAWASATPSRSSWDYRRRTTISRTPTDKEGQLQFAKYDLFLSQQIAHFLEQPERLSGPQRQRARQHHRAVRKRRQHDAQLPQPADADRRRSQHGPEARHLLARNGETRMSNVYLSILRSLGIEQESFADSTGTLSSSIFTRT